MFLAYFVYIGLIFIVTPLMSVSVRVANSKLHQEIFRNKYVDILIQEFIPILLLTITLGLRYNVGVDYLSYKNIYEYPDSSFDFSVSHIEPLYYFFNYFFYRLGFPYYALVCFVIFVQFYLFFHSFKPYPTIRQNSFVFLFITGTLFLFLNGQRQGLSFFVILFSLKYIYNRNLGKYLFFVIIASGFHYTSLMFIPLYFVYNLKRGIFDNLYIQLSIFILCLLLQTYLFDIIYNIILSISPAKYLRYGDRIIDWKMDLGTGYALLLSYLMNIITMFLFNWKIERKTNSVFLFVYRVWLIGTYLEMIFVGNMLLTRLTLCLTALKIILLPYIIGNVRKESIRKEFLQFILLLILLLSYLVYFLFLIKNGSSLCSPYQFVAL